MDRLPRKPRRRVTIGNPECLPELGEVHQILLRPHLVVESELRADPPLYREEDGAQAQSWRSLLTCNSRYKASGEFCVKDEAPTVVPTMALLAGVTLSGCISGAIEVKGNKCVSVELCTCVSALTSVVATTTLAPLQIALIFASKADVITSLTTKINGCGAPDKKAPVSQAGVASLASASTLALGSRCRIFTTFNDSYVSTTPTLRRLIQLTTVRETGIACYAITVGRIGVTLTMKLKKDERWWPGLRITQVAESMKAHGCRFQRGGQASYMLLAIE
ncbi:hypothetical protein DFH09DRAFT_1100559 [Mycena vulgaris]|nr:hypothetical protein DFH09DRAFT_1100559 [Mycena vulgaris]